jgi:hypothetical protein
MPAKRIHQVVHVNSSNVKQIVCNLSLQFTVPGEVPGRDASRYQVEPLADGGGEGTAGRNITQLFVFMGQRV